jgi:NADH-quinone oxidoreductase subunit L
MSRLVFLTFWGTCRADEHTKHHIHESPGSMTVPLIVLAGLSVAGGWIGIPAALRGGNHFEHFLAPVFVGGAEHAGAVHGATDHGAPLEGAAVQPGGTLEYVLMAVSLALALAGLALAHHLYVRRPELPGRIAARFRAAYTTLLNKYWVDEFYAATIVRGTQGTSRGLARFDLLIIDGLVNGVAALGRGFSWLSGVHDRWIVDGAVNGLAWCVRAAGSQARRLQTGVVQNYVLAVFVGVTAIVALLRLM